MALRHGMSNPVLELRIIDIAEFIKVDMTLVKRHMATEQHVVDQPPQPRQAVPNGEETTNGVADVEAVHELPVVAPAASPGRGRSFAQPRPLGGSQARGWPHPGGH